MRQEKNEDKEFDCVPTYFEKAAYDFPLFN